MTKGGCLAIIMGGGRGSRLYPLTKERCKPAIGFGGKYRLIDIPVTNCIHSGIKKVFVLTQFLTASLHRHIFQSYRFDIFSGGFVEILAAEQKLNTLDWYQGTADAVRQSMHHFLDYPEENILILSGDQLYRMDFSKLLQFHGRKNADVTIAVKPVQEHETLRMGILKIDKEARIIDFREKPKEVAVLRDFHIPRCPRSSSGTAFLASMGIYLFKKDVLVKVLGASRKEDFGKQIIPEIIPRHAVYGYTFRGYWEDIGTIRTYFEASIAMTRPRPQFRLIDEEWPIYTHPRFLPGSIVESCQMKNAIVCDGCRIRKSIIQDSIIGNRSTIKEGARIEETVLMGNDYYQRSLSLGPRSPHIGKNVFIQRAIVDKNVVIGDNCHISSQENKPNKDHRLYCIRDGITVIPRGSTLPAGFRI